MDTLSGIGVLDKAVEILRVVSAGPIGLRDLVGATGRSRATVHRLAQGLEAHGLLGRDGDGRYTLGVALIALGHAAADAHPLVAAAAPSLHRLQAETGESVQLFVREGGERLCVAAVDSEHELRTIVAVGARLPIGIGSGGRVLAGECGPTGWVDSVAERAPGVASVSAPVRSGGRVVAAVSISGPLQRLGDRPGQRFGGAVRDAATAIERALATRSS